MSDKRDDELLILEAKTNTVKVNTQNITKQFKKFIKSYPFLTGVAIATGIDALGKYVSNKKLTTRFFAQTPAERVLYKKMVNDLVSTGRYKKGRVKRVRGGVVYEVIRKEI